MSNFWEKLKKTGSPVLVLAPMAGITDSPFRQICRGFGADVVVSEMASATALVYAPKKTLAMLTSVKAEAPYVIQLFGSNPEHFAKAVKLLTDIKAVKKLGVSNYRLPDGLDINFGCPVAKVLKQGAGCALFKDLAKSRQVIEAVLANTNLPVSIKTRTQAGQVNILDWLDNIADLPISALMIHGRTLAQGFSGPVDYKIIKEARQHFKGVIIANGGINNSTGAKEVLKASVADGLGIGRGALGHPWIFQELQPKADPPLAEKNKKTPPRDVRKIILQHAKLVEKYNGNFGEFRKHLCWYATGLPNAKKLRGEFIKVNSLKDVKGIFNF
jgi:nifR3 family TIM-barrel protein